MQHRLLAHMAWIQAYTPLLTLTVVWCRDRMKPSMPGDHLTQEGRLTGYRKQHVERSTSLLHISRRTKSESWSTFGMLPSCCELCAPCGSSYNSQYGLQFLEFKTPSCIQLAYDWLQWEAFLNIVMNLKVLWNR